jgi:hypothetical protein
MKATIIGSDLLQTGEDVKILEINTNTTIYNNGADLLDYAPLFSMLVLNNITEFHYIYTDTEAFLPLNFPHRFEEILKEKCEENEITYIPHIVSANSVTVPYIEDADHKFILRQSFDTTALIDETYCADKFEFFKLMEGSEFIPKTYFGGELSLDTLDVLDYSNVDEPNLIKKHRYPQYDPMQLPAIYSIQNETEFGAIKSNLNLSENNMLQEFVYDVQNLEEGKYSVIRSIDILYGSEIDVINMGCYKQSAVLPVSFSQNEFKDGSREFKQKSRYKYITKALGKFGLVNYHLEEDSKILKYDGTLADLSTIQIGDYMRSIQFTDLNGNLGGTPNLENLQTYGWDCDLAQANATLTKLSTSLQEIVSAQVDTIHIRITLENGLSWVDTPSCKYFIEELGSTETRFENVNNFYIGDKLVITDSETNELTTVAITGLEMEYAIKTIYGLDFEPSDLFLVDIGEGLYSIMHNPTCWCSSTYCGNWCYETWCPTCRWGGGGQKPLP